MKFKIWADANRPIYHVEIDSPHELAVSARAGILEALQPVERPGQNARRATAARRAIFLWYFSVGEKTFYHDDMMGRGYRVENFEKIVSDPIGTIRSVTSWN